VSESHRNPGPLSGGPIHVVRVELAIRADSSHAVAFANALSAVAEEFAVARGFEAVPPGGGAVAVYEVRGTAGRGGPPA
jgi:hypothetical protein